MPNKFKIIYGMLALFLILTGCGAGGEAVRDTADDIRRVSFGPNAGDTGTTNDNNQGINRGMHYQNEQNRTQFPFETDRGFNFNNRDGGFDGFGQNNQTQPGQNNQAQQDQNPVTPQQPAGDQNQQAETNDNINAVVEEVVRLTNVERENNGLQPLQMDNELNNVAQLKSVDMADNGYFSHESPTYGSPFDMLDQFNVNYTVAAENIAAGQHTAEEVVRSWMNSEGHRSNILNEQVTHIGVGYEEGGTMRTYWTQMFIAK